MDLVLGWSHGIYILHTPKFYWIGNQKNVVVLIIRLVALLII